MYLFSKRNTYVFLLFHFIFTLLFKVSASSPLSFCSEATFSYIPDSSINRKTCNLSPDLSNTYPASVNSAFFNSYEKCGICYEMVGPYGAVKIRVEDITNDANTDESIPHFKVGANAAFSLLGLDDTSDLNQDRKISVSLRMISCDYSENINILTGDENYEGYSFSCLVLNSDMPISSVRIKENGIDGYKKLDKTANNYWYYDKGDLINYPINIRIGSITGEILNKTLNSKDSDEKYEFDGNFMNPGNSYYTIDTLKQEKGTAEKEKCCSVEYSSFASIYSSGEFNSNYEKENINSTLDMSSTNAMNIQFSNYGKLNIKSSIPIRADQFISVSLNLKADKICRDCLYISAYGKSADIKIQIQKENTLKNYIYLFDSLEVESNTFNGIVLYTKDTSIDVSIENIELFENSDAPSTEICLGNKTDWIPIVPESKETSINTIINTVNAIEDSDEEVEIIIKNISLINGTFILVKCENFKIIKNEAVNLIFVSNSNRFQTKECFMDYNNNFTDSFDCEIPDILTITKGEYNFTIPNDNKYFSNNTEKIIIEDGNIFYNYVPIIIPIVIPETNIQSSVIQHTVPQSSVIQYTVPISSVVHSTVVISSNTIQTNDIIETTKQKYIIISPITKEISRGENIIFRINPIYRDDYNNYNNVSQIIFIDNHSLNKNALYLKNCTNIYSINRLSLISCSVSNNTIKGNYSSLASGQNIEIGEGISINLISNYSTGGIFSQNITQIVNANISRSLKRNYTLSFNIIYYGENLHSNDLFPHKVYLSGVKRLLPLRSLNNDTSYNTYTFQFPNCTMGNYRNSTIDGESIEGITCNLPDFIPAGIYTKLTSEGFDVNPNNKIYVDFPYDFNKSQNYLIPESGDTTFYGRNEEESSSSKTWIIWVVLGILVAVLGAVVIIAFCFNRNRNQKDLNDTSNIQNDSGANGINNMNTSAINKSNNNSSQSQSS